MENHKKPKLFLVDDDEFFLKSLETMFLNEGDFEIETYATGELCLKNLYKKPDVVILDYHLDGIDKNAMNGLDVLDKIKISNVEIPVIFLSSQDKIEVAVSCLHHKAFDYVVKSETAFVRLKIIISVILKFQKIEKRLDWYREKR
ncbi:response regulator [Flavobacterium sp.]|uniref:response regulator n=1 Tax=Flavobacterium sp. TaxID=239 RepID=UPI0037527D4F